MARRRAGGLGHETTARREPGEEACRTFTSRRGSDTAAQATVEEKARAREWEAEIAKRRYAVIVDEAHSSQTGETARELKAILGAGTTPEEGEEEPDWEDRLNQVMQSRGRQPNLSFFAFTATPKGKTLRAVRAACSSSRRGSRRNTNR